MYLLEKFNPVQEWHTIVGNHRIKMSLMQFGQGSLTIAGWDHCVSRMIQQCLEEKPRMMVVIHNENSFTRAIHRGLL
ncbi:MAG TPA: hypothetical protein VJR03_02925 [Nitrospira sp.]|nr:hypothetical protein [Nitrospira sp.]